VWVTWWMGTSRDQSVDDEPAAAAVTVGGAPAEAPVEPAVLAVETLGASDLSVDAVSAPVGEVPPDSTLAPTGPGDVVGTGVAGARRGRAA
jgi:hypothetical protein